MIAIGLAPFMLKNTFSSNYKYKRCVTYHALLRSVKVVIEKLRLSFQPRERREHAVRVASQEGLSPQAVLILQICSPIIHLIEDLVLHYIGVKGQELSVLEQLQVPENFLRLPEHLIGDRLLGKALLEIVSYH